MDVQDDECSVDNTVGSVFDLPPSPFRAAFTPLLSKDQEESLDRQPGVIIRRELKPQPSSIMQVTSPCDVNSPPGDLILFQSHPLPLSLMWQTIYLLLHAQLRCLQQQLMCHRHKHLLTLATLLHFLLSLYFSWELLSQVHLESDQGLDQHTSGSWELRQRQKQRMLRPSWKQLQITRQWCNPPILNWNHLIAFHQHHRCLLIHLHLQPPIVRQWRNLPILKWTYLVVCYRHQCCLLIHLHLWPWYQAQLWQKTMAIIVTPWPSLVFNMLRRYRRRMRRQKGQSWSAKVWPS